MRAEYDFSKGKRGALLPREGKTRISIFIDNAVLRAFRAEAEKRGTGYQTMMNDALRSYLAESGQPLTKADLLRIIRQEIPALLRDLTSRNSARRRSASNAKT
jgi:BrnA antitoxin of type II toxin-antitoxin system